MLLLNFKNNVCLLFGFWLNVFKFILKLIVLEVIVENDYESVQSFTYKFTLIT